MARPRKEYNFSKDVKLKALRSTDFCCSECGKHKSKTPEKYLEIHHILPIWAYLMAKEYFNQLGINDDFMRSENNAEPLCITHHREKHEGETLEMYKQMAVAMLGIANAGD